MLFNIFYDYLREHNINDKHIIKIALDDKKLYNPDTLYDYISEQVIDDRNYYVLLDEVQYANQFEDILNSFHFIKKVIYNGIVLIPFIIPMLVLDNLKLLWLLAFVLFDTSLYWNFLYGIPSLLFTFL